MRSGFSCLFDADIENLWSNLADVPARAVNDAVDFPDQLPPLRRI